MKEQAHPVDILVVDDRPDKLLALEAALERLGENVVTAGSGREALRHLLHQPFAVILLDINMPGMDGFETAQLIRQYRGSRHTPIIFMTAAGDDALLGKSYALGAVDYVTTPVVPEVLRSKVRVFADLYRKTEQVQRQAEALEQQATRLQRLAAASLTINSMLSLDGIVQAITDAACHVVDAHQAMTTLTLPSGGARSAVAFSDAYAAFRGDGRGRSAEGLFLLASPVGRPVRLTQAEIDRDPKLRAASEEAGGPPRRGFLAAPLTERDGRRLGLIQLSDKRGGEFTEGDQAILVQLSQLGSIAVQNGLHAEAREANRIKDEFLATLSHELRTPLHALLGWARLLRTGPPDPARMARGLEVIERNVKLQTSLIDELLDVSRIAAGKLRLETRPVPLALIVEGAVDALRPAAEAKSLHLHVALGDDAAVLGDPERLHQVFSNLVSNAVKFTPKGGCVDVTLQRRGGDVEVRVSDTGIGIDPAFLPFVFERFRQADSSITRAQGGLGLGLAVTLHLLELHGGSVRAESAGPGRGATFLVRLPEIATVASSDAVAPVPEAKTPPRPSSIDSSPDGPLDSGFLNGGPNALRAGDYEVAPHSGVQTLDGLRVLIVDDDDDARELLRVVLLQHRAHVTTASSVREALDAIGALQPHVLVSDVAMQGEDGYDLIRRVRVRTPQEGGRVPALALTAYARKEDQLRALKEGFQMHATKPIEPHELIAAVAMLAGASTGALEPEVG